MYGDAVALGNLSSTTLAANSRDSGGCAGSAPPLRVGVRLQTCVATVIQSPGIDRGDATRRTRLRARAKTQRDGRWRREQRPDTRRGRSEGARGERTVDPASSLATAGSCSTGTPRACHMAAVTAPSRRISPGWIRTTARTAARMVRGAASWVPWARPQFAAHERPGHVRLIVVAIILFGTVPVLSAQPHYAWVYKHIGVVRYLEAHGKVNPNIDIYNRWPGFFALAQYSRNVAGRPNPETYAAWAELFFIVLDAVLVMAAVKRSRESSVSRQAQRLCLSSQTGSGRPIIRRRRLPIVLGLALIVIVLRQLRWQDQLLSAAHPLGRAHGARTAVAAGDRTTRRSGLAGQRSRRPGPRRGHRRKSSADAVHAARQRRAVDARPA